MREKKKEKGKEGKKESGEGALMNNVSERQLEWG